MTYLISLVISGYNSFVKKKKYYRDGNCSIIERTQVETISELEEYIKENYWIKRYIEVKNKESNFQYSDSELKKIVFNALDNPTRQLEYIDKKFRFPFLYEGSTTYTLLKNYFVQNQNLSVDKFSQHVIMLLKRSIDKIY